MPAIGPEKWQALSPYLDQALEIAPAEREAWLATLRKQNPTLAADLRTLLKEHHALDEERFLQLGAATPLGPPWAPSGWPDAAMVASKGRQPSSS